MLANLLEVGAAALTATMLRHGSVPVVYRRGDDSCDIAAVVGRSDLESVQGDAVVTAQTVDFIVDPARLILGGLRVEPREGDRIVRRDGDLVLEYEVLAANGRAHRFDPLRKSMRIHTLLKLTRLA